MAVFEEKPLSFEIEDFLAALAARNKNYFFMIDPETSLAIDRIWLNIPRIGLSTLDRSKGKSLGFQTKTTELGSDDQKEYFVEALLILDVPSGSLPPEVKGEAWILQVKDFEKMDEFRPIAEALSDHFKVHIVMTPSQINDDDPHHMSARPVNDQFPNGPQFQPIVIKFVK